MSAEIYSRLLGEFRRGFHESTDTRACVEIRSPGRFQRGWEPSKLDTVNYETEAVIASVAVPYSVGSDESTHAVAVTTREYWQPPELLERFKELCSKAGAELPLAIHSPLALDWIISRDSIACWMSLLTRLHGFTVRDPDGCYQEHQLITNPWQASADAIEHLRLNTDSPGWPDEAEQTLLRGSEPDAADGSGRKKIKPSVGTYAIICALQRGQSVDEIAAAHSTSADNVRQVKKRLSKDEYDLRFVTKRDTL